MAETVTVRPADSDEAPAVALLWEEAHLARRNGRSLPPRQRELVLQRMAAPDALLFVADDPARRPSGGAVVGCALGLPGRADDGAGPVVPGLLHLSAVAVAPERWGRRTGGLLVVRVLAEAVAHGYREAQFWAQADNARANRLCRSLGFRRTGRARVDDWGELVVHYRRRLDPAD